MKLNVLKSTGSWIYFPKEIEFLFSEDGKKFISMKKFSSTEIENLNGNIEGIFKNTKAKYIKVIAKNLGIIPDGNPGSGSNAWLFIDEISVE